MWSVKTECAEEISIFPKVCQQKSSQPLACLGIWQGMSQPTGVLRSTAINHVIKCIVLY